MPPFVFTPPPTPGAIGFAPPPSPYFETIADLLQRPAQYQAAALLQGAALRARAAELAGYMAGMRGPLIGQAVAQTIQLPYTLRAVEAAQQQQATKLALEQEQLTTLRRGNVEAVQAKQDASDLGTLLTAAMQPDGTYDVGRLTASFKDPRNTRIAPHAAQVVEAATRSNDGLQAFADKQDQSEQAAIRDAAEWTLRNSDPSPDDFVVALNARAQAGRIRPTVLASLIASMAGRSPTQAMQQISAYVAPHAQVLPAGATLVETRPGQIPRSVLTAPDPRTAEVARHNAAMEQIQKLQVGREAAANAETARHNRAVELIQDPLAGLRQLAPPAGEPAAAPVTVPSSPSPPLGPSQPPLSLIGPETAPTPGQGPVGRDFLQRLPPGIATEVKAYAEGRRPFPAGFALKSPYFQRLIQLVGQYDPTFDAVNYNARNRARQDFTSGKSAQTINALNTVAQHLDRLSTSTEALNNSWSPAYNTVANFLSRHSGSPVVTNFETDKKAVTDELTRAWRQTGGSEQDIKSWASVLNAANSPTQLHGSIAEMGQLLEGKLAALEAQWHSAMGAGGSDLQIVTPVARATLAALEAKATPTTQRAGVALASSTPPGPPPRAPQGWQYVWEQVPGRGWVWNPRETP